jgi:hypothetical protein
MYFLYFLDFLASPRMDGRLAVKHGLHRKYCVGFKAAERAKSLVSKRRHPLPNIAHKKVKTPHAK